MKDQTYVTWESDRDRVAAVQEVADILEGCGGLKTHASHRSYLDIETNRSVRTGMTRHDYDRFRPTERVPVKPKEAIRMCMKAYEKVGIIKNIIDLMGDFASQGIKLNHPDPKIENFYRSWWNKINGGERSERFLNTLYRCGNVIVRRREARINKSTKKDLSKGAKQTDIKLDKAKVRQNWIGCKYDILNPLLVEVEQGPDALYLDRLKYRMRVSKQTKTALFQWQEENLHEDIFKTHKSHLDKGDTVPLDPNEISIYHYKKDDWEIWARPLIYAILDDIIYLEKMKLADMAALDGAISNIRLWTVGALEHKILPTKATLNKLRDILASNTGGGVMDLIWGPELKFQESNSQIYKYLGSEKYNTVLSSIYAGMGVPPTLTGVAGQSGGFTNNFISLKTLVERLEYGRDLLVHFWTQEIRRVQKAMGFSSPAIMQFSSMNLSDDVAEKNLLLQLADRDVVSRRTVQESLGYDDKVEMSRLNKEESLRAKDKLPPKASPYHDPQKQEVLDNEMTKMDKQHEQTLETKEIDHKNKIEEVKSQPKPTGRPEDGRPKNAKDKEKRKKRNDTKPRSKPGKANLTLWAQNAQKTIAEIITPGLLEYYDKKTLRSLTRSQASELEDIKFGILANLEPFQEVSADAIASIMSNGAKVAADMRADVEEYVHSFVAENGRNPNTDELRQIHCLAYAFSD